MAKEHRDRVLLGLGFSSFLFLAAALVVARRPIDIRDEMLAASRRMEQAVQAIRDCRESKGVGIDPAMDINRTGFIGLESSLITTSLGNLEAKRTTANPNFAGLIALLLHQAGVRKGDAVAIGASSSFPALIIASLCAVETMELRAFLICSLGASQWGANHPDFNWQDMQACLNRSGLLSTQPLALSLGGDGDVGKDMSPEGQALLLRLGRETRRPFLYEPDLEQNVRQRLRIFETAAGQGGIQAFINVGGSYANMGTDSEILKIGPGLAAFSEIPPVERRGVIFEMAARHIPVIHLLYIKGLCDNYGLPWDPTPLPEPGQGAIFERQESDPWHFLILAIAYFCVIAVVLAIAARL